MAKGYCPDLNNSSDVFEFGYLASVIGESNALMYWNRYGNGISMVPKSNGINAESLQLKSLESIFGKNSDMSVKMRFIISTPELTNNVDFSEKNALVDINKEPLILRKVQNEDGAVVYTPLDSDTIISLGLSKLINVENQPWAAIKSNNLFHIELSRPEEMPSGAAITQLLKTHKKFNGIAFYYKNKRIAFALKKYDEYIIDPITRSKDDNAPKKEFLQKIVGPIATKKNDIKLDSRVTGLDVEYIRNVQNRVVLSVHKAATEKKGRQSAMQYLLDAFVDNRAEVIEAANVLYRRKHKLDPESFVKKSQAIAVLSDQVYGVKSGSPIVDSFVSLYNSVLKADRTLFIPSTYSERIQKDLIHSNETIAKQFVQDEFDIQNRDDVSLFFKTMSYYDEDAVGTMTDKAKRLQRKTKERLISTYLGTGSIGPLLYNDLVNEVRRIGFRTSNLSGKMSKDSDPDSIKRTRKMSPIDSYRYQGQLINDDQAGITKNGMIDYYAPPANKLEEYYNPDNMDAYRIHLRHLALHLSRIGHFRDVLVTDAFRNVPVDEELQKTFINYREEAGKQHYTRSMSGLVNGFLSVIPQYSYEYKNGILNKKTRKQGSKAFGFPVEAFSEEMMDTVSTILTNESHKGINVISRVLESLRDKAKQLYQSDPNNDTAHMISSFLDSIGELNPVKIGVNPIEKLQNGEIGLYTLGFKTRSIHQSVSAKKGLTIEQYALTPEYAEINDLAKSASAFLSSLVNYFGSLSSNDATQAVLVYDRDTDTYHYNQVSRSSTKVDKTKNNHEQKIISAFYPDGSAGHKASDLVGKSDGKYIFTKSKDGGFVIRRRSDDSIIFTTKQRNDGSHEFILSDEIRNNIKAVQGIFGDLQINLKYRKKDIIRRLLNDGVNVWANKKDSSDKKLKSIDDVLGNMLSTLYVNVNDDYKRVTAGKSVTPAIVDSLRSNTMSFLDMYGGRKLNSLAETLRAQFAMGLSETTESEAGEPGSTPNNETTKQNAIERLVSLEQEYNSILAKTKDPLWQGDGSMDKHRRDVLAEITRIRSSITEQLPGTTEDTFTLIDFYDELYGISVVQVESEPMSQRKRIILPEGTKMFMDFHNNFIKRSYPAKMTEAASIKGSHRLKAIAGRGRTLADPVADGDIKLLNANVISVGISNRGNKHGNKKTTIAEAHMTSFDGFIKGAISDRKTKEFTMIPMWYNDGHIFYQMTYAMESTSSRRIPVADQFGSINQASNDILIKVGKNEYIANEPLMNQWFMDVLDVRWNDTKLSMKRWIDFFINNPSASAVRTSIEALAPSLDGNDVKAIMELRTAMRSAIDGLEATPELKSIFSEYGLAENGDWVDAGGFIQFGNAFEMNDGVLNRPSRNSMQDPIALYFNYQWHYKNSLMVDNYGQPLFTDIDSDTSPEASRILLTQLRRNLLFEEFSNLEKDFNNHRIPRPTGINVNDQIQKEGQKSYETHKWTTGSKEKGFQWDPIYEAYFMMQYAISNSLINYSIGSVYDYKNTKDFNKYNKIPATISISAVSTERGKITGMPNGMVRKTIQDDVINTELSPTVYRSLFAIATDIKAQDGLQVVTHLYKLAMVDEHGAEYGPFRKSDTTFKTIGNGLDINTGRQDSDKSSTIAMDNQLFEQSKDRNMDAVMVELNEYRLDMVDAFMRSNIPGMTIEKAEANSSLFDIFQKGYDEAGYERGQELVYAHIINMRALYGVDLLQHITGMYTLKSAKKIDSGSTNWDVTFTDAPITTGLVKNQVYPSSQSFIFNPNQSIEGEVTRLGQEEFIIARSPFNNESVAVIEHINFYMAMKAINDMSNEIDRVGIKQYLEGILSDSLSQSTEISNMLYAIREGYMTMDYPAVLEFIQGQLASRLNKGVQFKVRGAKLVQEPSEGFIDMVSIDVDGQRIRTTRGALESRIKKTKTQIPFTKDGGLRHYQFMVDDGSGQSVPLETLADENDINDLMALQVEYKDLSRQRKEISKINYNGKHNATLKTVQNQIAINRQKVKAISSKYIDMVTSIVPAEAVAPFVFARDMFGYRSQDEFLKAMNNNGPITYRPSVDDMFTITMNDGSTYNLRQYLDDGVMISDVVAEIESKGGFNEVSEDTLVLKTPLGGNIKTLQQLISYYENSHKLLEMFAARIPSTIMGSGAIYKVVDWVYSSNRIHTSSIKSLFDSSDYDIDELTAIYRTMTNDVTEDGLVTAYQSLGTTEISEVNVSSPGGHNAYADALMNPYKDVRNLPLLLTPLDMQDVMDATQDKADRDRRIGYGSVSTQINDHNNAQAGKNVVPMMANSSNVYARISGMTEEQIATIAPWISVANKSSDPKVLMDEFVKFSLEQAKGLQIAVDNGKLQRMTLIGMNEQSAGIVAAMIASGKTLIEAGDFMNEHVVKVAMRKYIQSQNIHEYPKKLQDIIDDEIEKRSREADPEVVKQKRVNRINHLLNAISVLNGTSEKSESEQAATLNDISGVDTYIDDEYERDYDPDELNKLREDQLAREQRLAELQNELDMHLNPTYWYTYNAGGVQTTVSMTERQASLMPMDMEMPDGTIQQITEINQGITASKTGITDESWARSIGLSDNVSEVKKLTELKEYAARAEATYAATRLIMPSGVEGRVWDVYNQYLYVSYKLDQDLAAFLNGENYEPGAYRSRFEGYSKEGFEASYLKNDNGLVEQETIDNIAIDVVKSISQFSDNIEVYGLAGSGVEEAFSKALHNAGMTNPDGGPWLYSPMKGMHRSASGAAIYDEGEIKTGTSRFLNEGISEDEIFEVPMAPNTKRYEVIKNLIQTKDPHLFVVLAGSDGSVDSILKTKDIGLSNQNIHIIHIPTTENMTAETVSSRVAAEVNKVISNELEAPFSDVEMAQFYETGLTEQDIEAMRASRKVKVAFTGGDLAALSVGKQSEYEKKLKWEQSVREAINLRAFAESSMTVMAHLNILNANIDVYRKGSIHFGKHMDELQQSVISLLGFGDLTNGDTFYRIQESFMEHVAFESLKQMGENGAPVTVDLSSTVNFMPTLGMTSEQIVKAKKDISDSLSAVNAIEHMASIRTLYPYHFMNIVNSELEMIDSGAKTLDPSVEAMLHKFSVDVYGNLVFENEGDMPANEVEYNRILLTQWLSDPSRQELLNGLKVYVLLSGGWKYTNNNMFGLVPYSYFEDINNGLQYVKKQITEYNESGIESPWIASMKKNFPANTVVRQLMGRNMNQATLERTPADEVPVHTVSLKRIDIVGEPYFYREARIVDVYDSADKHQDSLKEYYGSTENLNPIENNYNNKISKRSDVMRIDYDRSAREQGIRHGAELRKLYSGTDTIEVDQSPMMIFLNPTEGYSSRTVKNAKSGDITIAIAQDFSSRGELLTESEVNKAGNIYFSHSVYGNIVESANQFVLAANSVYDKKGRPIVINGAGNSLASMSLSQEDADAAALDFLTMVLQNPDRRFEIDYVLSGGQTGFDVAIIKAAKSLGLRTRINAAKSKAGGYLVRLQDGSDVSLTKDEYLKVTGLDAFYTTGSRKAGGMKGITITGADATNAYSKLGKDAFFAFADEYMMGLWEGIGSLKPFTIQSSGASGTEEAFSIAAAKAGFNVEIRPQIYAYINEDGAVVKGYNEFVGRFSGVQLQIDPSLVGANVASKPVYSSTARSTKAVDAFSNTMTEMEFIRIQDAGLAASWLSPLTQQMAITTYGRKTGYEVNSYVNVNGIPAKITGTSNVGITVKKLSSYSVKKSIELGSNNKARHFNKKVVSALVSMARNSMPKMDVVVISSKEAKYSDAKAYWEDGSLNMVGDKITPDVPVHEFTHFLAPLLKNSSIEAHRIAYKKLEEAAFREIDNRTALASNVANKYGYDFDDVSDDFVDEMVATISGLVSVDKIVNHLKSQEQSVTKKGEIDEVVTSFWDNLHRSLDELLPSSAKRYDFKDKIKRQPTSDDILLNNINEDSNLEDVVNAIANHLLNGNPPFIDYDAAMQMKGAVKKAKEFTPAERIGTLESLHDILMVGIGTTKFETWMNKAYANAMARNMSSFQANDGTVNIRMFGEDVRFSELDGKDLTKLTEGEISSVIEKIIDKVVPIIRNNKKKIGDNIRDIANELISLNTGTHSQMSSKQYKDAFVKKIEDGSNEYEFAVISREQAQFILDKLNITPNEDKRCRVYRYSEFANLPESNPLSKLYNKVFEGSDPLISVHSIIDESGDTRIDITVLTDSDYDLATGSTTHGKDTLITKNFMSDEEAVAQTVTGVMPMTYGSSKIVQATAIVAYMNSISGIRVNTDRIAAISVTSNGRNEGQAEYLSVTIEKAMDNLSILASNESFMSMMPNEVQSVFENPQSLNGSELPKDIFAAIEVIWDTRASIAGYNKGNYEQKLEAIRAFRNGKSTKAEFIGFVKDQMRFIQKRNSRIRGNIDSKNWKTIVEKDKEYAYLSMILTQLESYIEIKVEKQFSSIQMWGHSELNQRNTLVGNTLARSREYINERNALVQEAMYEIDQQVSKIYPAWAIKDLLGDTQGKFFKKLFKKPIEDGKGVKYNDLRIHHTMKDSDTARAVSNGELTNEEVEFGAYVVSVIKKHIKNIIRAQILNDRTNEKFLKTQDAEGITYVLREVDPAKLEAMVDAAYNANYEDGMMLAVYKNDMEYMGDMSYVKAAKQAMRMQVDANEIIQQAMGLSEKNDSYLTYPSMFLPQFSKAARPGEGGMRRKSLMGLEEVSGTNVLKSDDVGRRQNEMLSTNIVNILYMLVADSYTKQVMEKHVLPLMHSAHITAELLAMTETQDKGDVDVVHKAIEEYKQKAVLGQRGDNFISKELKKNNPEVEKKLSGIGSFIMNMMSFTGLALSFPVAVTSFTANMVEMFETAAANSVSNPYKYFTLSDIRKAIGHYLKDHKKVLALLRRYRWRDGDLSSLMSHPKYKTGHRHMLTQHVFHFMNRMTDVFARDVIAVAQMVHDGTWDAHDEGGNYDAKKDERFFKDGKFINEDSKANYLLHIEELKRSEFYSSKQADKEDAVAAYTMDDVKRLSNAADEFVIGTFGKDVNPAAKNTIFGQMMFMFKTWMASKVETRLGGTATAILGLDNSVMVSPEGAIKRVEKDVNGNYVRTYEGLKKEGSWISTARIIGERVPFLNDFLKQHHMISEVKSFNDFAALSPLERMNLVRASIDLMIFAGGIALVSGLKGLTADDDREKALEDSRLIRAFQNGFLTVASTSPKEMFDLFTGWAVINNTKRALNLVTGQGSWSDAKMFIPGVATVETISETASMISGEGGESGGGGASGTY